MEQRSPVKINEEAMEVLHAVKKVTAQKPPLDNKNNLSNIGTR
jgi:hypothetical protein